MKRRLVIAGLVTIAGVAAILVSLSKPWKSESSHPQPNSLPKAHHAPSPLPNASEFESMTAHQIKYSPKIYFPEYVLNRPPENDELPDFDIPRDRIEAILDTLRPARAIDFQSEGYAPWVIFGELIIKCKDGRTLRVALYLTRRDEPGAFGVFGVDPGDKTWGKYRAGASRTTWAAILDAYVATQRK